MEKCCKIFQFSSSKRIWVKWEITSSPVSKAQRYISSPAASEVKPQTTEIGWGLSADCFKNYCRVPPINSNKKLKQSKKADECQ